MFSRVVQISLRIAVALMLCSYVLLLNAYADENVKPEVSPKYSLGVMGFGMNWNPQEDRHFFGISGPDGAPDEFHPPQSPAQCLLAGAYLFKDLRLDIGTCSNLIDFSSAAQSVAKSYQVGVTYFATNGFSFSASLMHLKRSNNLKGSDSVFENGSWTYADYEIKERFDTAGVNAKVGWRKELEQESLGWSFLGSNKLFLVANPVGIYAPFAVTHQSFQFKGHNKGRAGREARRHHEDRSVHFVLTAAELGIALEM